MRSKKVWYGVAPLLPTPWTAIDATRWWHLDRAPAEVGSTPFQTIPAQFLELDVPGPRSLCLYDFTPTFANKCQPGLHFGRHHLELGHRVKKHDAMRPRQLDGRASGRLDEWYGARPTSWAAIVATRWCIWTGRRLSSGYCQAA
jgi:hypothetical protein